MLGIKEGAQKAPIASQVAVQLAPVRATSYDLCPISESKAGLPRIHTGRLVGQLTAYTFALVSAHLLI